MKQFFAFLFSLFFTLALYGQRVEIEVVQDTTGYTKVTTTYSPNGTDKNISYEYLGPDSTSLQSIVSDLISQSNNTYTTAISLERQALDNYTKAEGIDETADAILSAINAGTINEKKNESLIGQFSTGLWQLVDIEADTVSVPYYIMLDGNNQAYLATAVDSAYVVDVDLKNPAGFMVKWANGQGNYGPKTFSYAFEIPVGDQPFRRFQYATGNRRLVFIRTQPVDQNQ